MTRCPILLQAIALLALAVGPLRGQELPPARVFHVYAGEQQNTLAPCDIAIDQTRNLAFIATSLTGDFPIVDLATRQIVRTISTPFSSARHRIALSYHAPNWRLLAIDADRPDRMLALNALSGEPIAAFVHPEGKAIAGVLGDAERNVLYLTDGSDLVRILSASSLRTVDSIRASGMQCSGIAIDSVRKEVLFLSRVLDNGRIVIRTFYTVSPHPVLRSLSFASPEEAGLLLYSRADKRMVAVGKKRALITNSAGVREMTIEISGGISDAAICEATGTLYIADAAGFASNGDHGRAGKIHTVNLLTKARDSLRLGYGVRHIAVYQPRAVLLAVSGQTNDLIYVDCYTGREYARTDLGESAECLAYDPDSAMLYAADNFGEGNGIARLPVYADTCIMLRSGMGPCGLAFDRSLRTLFTLDHFQSALSIIAVDRDGPPGRLGIGSRPEARTGAWSDLSIDERAHLLLVCIPEFGSWTLLDGRESRTIREGMVDGYHFEEEDSPGLLQGAVSARLDRFLILRLRDRMLNLYRLSDAALLAEIDLRHLDWERIAPVEGGLLFLDENTGMLYIGPYALSAVDGTMGAVLPASNLVAGITSNGGRIVALDVTEDSVALTVHVAATGSLQSRQPLFAKLPGPVHALFDPEAVRIFVSETRTGLVRQYDLLHVARAEDAPAMIPWTPGIPYPFPAAAGGRVTIPSLEGSIHGRVRIEVYDRCGRFVREVAGEEIADGASSLGIDMQGLPSGLFFLHFRVQNSSRIVPLLIR